MPQDSIRLADATSAPGSLLALLSARVLLLAALVGSMWTAPSARKTTPRRRRAQRERDRFGCIVLCGCAPLLNQRHVLSREYLGRLNRSDGA
jgi:hypothetical protein